MLGYYVLLNTMRCTAFGRLHVPTPAAGHGGARAWQRLAIDAVTVSIDSVSGSLRCRLVRYCEHVAALAEPGSNNTAASGCAERFSSAPSCGELDDVCGGLVTDVSS